MSSSGAGPDGRDAKSGADREDEHESLVGKVLSGRYLIESSLGEGGMGTVYLAQHTLMHKRLAIKVLHPEMTRLPEVVARFEREAMAAAHIDHPNVAAATDFGKLDNGSFFLVLEFVEGRSLRQALEKGPLSVFRSLHIAQQIVSALVRAHTLGIVHRDLKPENIMLVERDGDPDCVKVLDFGIAKVPVDEISKHSPFGTTPITQLGIVYGTPEYMAPEQALGQAIDARADLYALGVMLYEMLAGVRPFEAETRVALLGLQVTQTPPAISERAPEVSVPPAVEAMVRALLEKEAAERPADARAVLETIEQHLEEIPRTGSEPLRPRLPSLPFRRSAPGKVQLLAHAATVAGTPTTLDRPVLPSKTLASGFGQSLRVIGREVTARLPITFRDAPLAFWLGGIGLFVLVGMVVGLIAIRSASMRHQRNLATDIPQTAASVSASTPPAVGASVSASGTASVAPVASAETAPDSTTAPPDALRKALEGGHTSLEALAQRYPKDPEPLKALGRMYTVWEEPKKAMIAYRRLLALSPQSERDPEVSEAVIAATQKDQSVDAAFALMEIDMKTMGPELLYSLAYEGKARGQVAARAARALKTSTIQSRASKAVVVALKLRAAQACAAKYKLLDDAQRYGDRRALTILKGLLSTKGCGFMDLADCYPCMRRTTLLGNTIAAIEARTNEKK